jgi:pyruvate dehydrogenase E2 component (dihydrolipoamide acetyltransferase)
VGAERQVLVPDIGEFEDVEVIEVLVAAGDHVAVEQSLITLESEKATMEIPSPFAGVVKELHVAVGDKVSEGSRILTLEVGDEDAAAAPESPARSRRAEAPPTLDEASPAPPGLVPAEARSARAAPGEPARAAGVRAHAGPSVRRLARELGVDLARVPGSGRKGRVLREDVEGYVARSLASAGEPQPPAALSLPEMPEIDFSRWGEVELRPLEKLRRVSARNVHRSWLTVPQVTQFDEADITELEEFRREKQPEAEQRGVKLTPLAFLMKATAVVLRDFQHFNASLDRSGETLVVKKYIHVGIAVDTDRGLVVPVVRDVDKKGLFELAGELAAISQKARERRLRPEDLAGGTFSISNLGGIGGTAFTPIVNAPEVAILGVAAAQMKPVYQGGEFVPRLLLPLCLSYDHRVIDGADAARFTARLKTVLADIRNLLL